MDEEHNDMATEQVTGLRTSDQLAHLPDGSKCEPVRHLDIRPPVISSQDSDLPISISTTSPIRRMNMQIL